jgi:hypothetical protein
MRVRINSLEGHFYPEVKQTLSRRWRVVYIDRLCSKWAFCSFPEATGEVTDYDFRQNQNRGYKTKDEALDVLESYIGAGESVIACDIIKRKDL